MFDLHLPQAAEIAIPDGTFDDGTPHRRTLPARVRFFDAAAQIDSTLGPLLADRGELLIQCAAVPQPGSLVTAGGRTVTLRSVRHCRDLAGRLIAYRCAIL